MGSLDLVDDRAVKTRTEDLLGHAKVADDLAELVQQVPTPANIAIYAPWGSGKTGLANLLAERLRGITTTKMVRFDAFKYAETPLRRHFISQLAKSLKVKKDKYTVGLYRETTDTTITLPPRDLLLIAALFVAVLALIQTVVVIGTAIWALVAHQPFASYIGGALGSSVVVSFPTAALAAMFVVLTGKVLPITRKRTTPSGDEEFEQLFRDLVDDAKTKRLVVFIDELDRCSPRQVVSALETLRTFLEVPKCVFVVAADQLVLERALDREVRQSTPIDIVNPYYSAGGAYLDKIFQYQIALPPILPRRLSTLALTLVKDRLGVWAKVPSRDQIVSILVPTHVTSPRRVKVLLNSYAMTYRIAEAMHARADRGFELGDRYDVLAKLVCLKVEFPLFARDLQLDERLPELVLSAADDQPKPPDVADDVWTLARSYAQEQRPTDLVILGESPEPPDSSERSDRTALGKAQDKQLVRYLRRTHAIAPITADLLYMESAGAAYGLPPSVAATLEQEAVDGSTGVVASTVESLSPEAQVASVRFLARLGMEASIGIETKNVLSSLLAAVRSVQPANLNAARAGAIDSVLAMADGVALEGSDVPGLLALASEADGDRRTATLGLAMTIAEARSTPAYAIECLPYADLLEDGAVAELAVTCLTDPEAAPEFGRQLATLRPNDQLVDLMGGRFAEAVAAAERASEDDEEDPKLDLCSAFGAALDAAADIDAVGPQRLAAVGLHVDDEDLRTLVFDRSDVLLGSPTIDVRFASLVLSALPKVDIGVWPQCLEAIAKVEMPPEDISASADSLAAAVWPIAVAGAPPRESEFAAIDAIGRFSGESDTESFSTLQSLVRATLPVPVASEADFDAAESWISIADRFVSAGLLSPALVNDHLALRLAATAAQALVAQPAAAPPVRILQRWTRRAGLGAARGEVERLVAGVTNCSWLPAGVRESIILQATAGLSRFEPTSVPFTPDQIAALSASHVAHFDWGLRAWLERLAGSPEDVLVATVRFRKGAILDPVVAGLRAYAARLSQSDLQRLVLPLLTSERSSVPSVAYLEAIGLTRVEDKAMAAKLTEIYITCTRNEQREVVLSLWQAANITTDRARKSLIEQVYIDLLGLGAQSFDLALKYSGLCAPVPHGVTGALRKALGKSGWNPARTLRARAKLKELGLT